MKNLTPKESAKIIASLAKNVTIDERGIDNLSRAILEGLKRSAISVNNFSQIQFHPSPNDPKAVDWIFVLDTLNYSFWSKKDTPKWTVSGQTGYFALCAVVKRAIDVSLNIGMFPFQTDYLPLSVKRLSSISDCLASASIFESGITGCL
ncbi:Queuosine salvage protein [Anthophora retusa]